MLHRPQAEFILIYLTVGIFFHYGYIMLAFTKLSGSNWHFAEILVKKEDLRKLQFNLILLDNIQNCSDKPHCMRSYHMLAGLQPKWAGEGYWAYPTDCICTQDSQAVPDH